MYETMLCRPIIAVFLGAALVHADVVRGQQAYDQGDYAAALDEWQASAWQGNAEAQYLLGAMYRDGKGVSRDMLQFVYWWSEAAKRGNLQAQRYVGWPITRADAPRLNCLPSRGSGRFDNMERVEFKIELRNTRPFVEQMVLANAENYTQGYEPKRPNVEVLLYQIDGERRVPVPVQVTLAGGSSGPYGDEARLMHWRNHGVFDEALLVGMRISVEESERKFYGDQFLAEMQKLVAQGQGNPQLLELNRKMLEGRSPYFDSLLPNRSGTYEIVARYASRDPRFWPGQLTSPPLRFEVVKTRAWIDAFRQPRK
jgi:hypothetical protein